MTFVMADVHGRYDLFVHMLPSIGFSDEDELFILGDAIDRGVAGIKVLLSLLNIKNTHLLMGDHEDMALPVLYLLSLNHSSKLLKESSRCKRWMEHGGAPTIEGFEQLDAQTQSRLLSFLQTLPHRVSLTINGQVYHLSHTLPDTPPLTERTPKLEYLWGEPDYRLSYGDHTVFITGHTPTALISPAYRGRIWRGNGHIAIACGAAWDGALGCVCLETQREYYVK